MRGRTAKTAKEEVPGQRTGSLVQMPRRLYPWGSMGGAYLLRAVKWASLVEILCWKVSPGAGHLATFSLPHAGNPDDLKEAKIQRKFCVCTDRSGVVVG